MLGAAREAPHLQGGCPPRIADYQGQGPLAAWLRAATVRTALNLRRSARRQPLAEEEALAESTLPEGHPEQELLRDVPGQLGVNLPALLASTGE